MDYLILQIFSKNDFSDEKCLAIREQDISVVEFIKLMKEQKFTNPFSKKVLRFIFGYNNEVFKPEKFGTSEPIRDSYEENISLIDMVDWLSYTGGDVSFKRNKKLKYQGTLRNERIAKIWIDDKCNTVFNDPELLSSATFWFPYKSKKVEEQLLVFFKELSYIMEASLAFAYRGRYIRGVNLYKKTKEEIENEIIKFEGSPILIWRTGNE